LLPAMLGSCSAEPSTKSSAWLAGENKEQLTLSDVRGDSDSSRRDSYSRNINGGKLSAAPTENTLASPSYDSLCPEHAVQALDRSGCG
jgi:hypothetical protein